MKKLLFFESIILIFCLCLIIYHSLSIKIWDSILYKDKTQISVVWNKDNLDYTDLINDLQVVSKNEKVDVSQYWFTEINELTSYSSNPSINKNLILVKGEFPTFNSNTSIGNDKNKKKQGLFLTPTNHLNFIIKDLSQLKNSGLSSTLYVSGNLNSVEKVLEIVNKYGESTIQDTLSKTALSNDNYKVEMITVVLLIIYVCTLFIYLLRDRYQYAIRKSFGFSFWNNLIINIKQLFLLILFSTSLSLILFVLRLLVMGNFNFINSFITLFLPVILALFLSSVILISLFSTILYSHFSLLDTIKGQQPIKYLDRFILVSKYLVTIGIVLSLLVTLDIRKEYSKIVNNLDIWKQTKNIYQTKVTNQINFEDMKNLDDFNKNSELFYELLQTNNVPNFIMDASNFMTIHDKPNEKPYYLYQKNVSNEDEAIFSPAGKKITIDENYLKFNPIMAENNKKIADLIVHDPNTLNILVPIKYLKYETRIKAKYLEDELYMLKIFTANSYNKALGFPEIDVNKNDLKINLIFTKNNQKYFTYSNGYGSASDNYKITDPIAVIFKNHQFHRSQIGTYVTDGLFVQSDTNKTPYSTISPSLIKSGLGTDVPFVQSPYEEYTQNLTLLKNKISSMNILLVSLSFLSIFLMLWYVTIFYAINKSKIYLKYILGYSFFEQNKKLILQSIIMNISILFVAYFYSKNLFLLTLGWIYIIFELVAICIIILYSSKTNRTQLLKGAVHD